jgi:hypothetical protein
MKNMAVRQFPQAIVRKYQWNNAGTKTISAQGMPRSKTLTRVRDYKHGVALFERRDRREGRHSHLPAGRSQKVFSRTGKKKAD